MRILFLGIFLIFTHLANAQKVTGEERKEFIDAFVGSCADEANKEKGLKNALSINNYCNCMAVWIVDNYTLDEITKLGKKLLDSPTAKNKVANCMTTNLKEGFWDTFKKEFIKPCVDGVNKQQSLKEISGTKYCECMFQRIKTEYSLTEILDESFTENPRFEKDATDCIMKAKK